MWKFAYFAILSVLSATTLPDFPLRPAGEYPNAIVRDGLRLAIVPVEDPKDQRKYLGMDLRNTGYVPALLILENDSKNSVILVRDRVQFTRSGLKRPLADPAERTTGDKTLEATTVVPFIGIFSAVAKSKLTKLRRRLMDLEVRSTTVSPGGSMHGFFFIPERPGYTKREQIRLVIPFVRSGSAEEALLIECVF